MQENAKRSAEDAGAANMAELDEELYRRFAKRTGTLEAFLREWVKLPESQDKLFDLRGPSGQNYLQFKLAANDITMSTALVEICKWFAETSEPERVVKFLHVVDSQGNDLWHYLADCLAREEQEDALTIARSLIQLQIDFCRKNDDDESALSKLLLPTPRWKSINSMNQAREIELAEIKNSFSDSVNLNESMLHEVMFGVFADDQRDNSGRLSQIVLDQAMRPQTGSSLRSETKEVFFNAVGGQKRETIAMLMAESGNPVQFEQLMRLLIGVIEDNTRDLAARDIQTAKAERQRLLTVHMALRNRANQTLLFKSIRNESEKALSVLIGSVVNENLVMPGRNELGKSVTRPYIVDKRSPAPTNPRLTLLLQQDNLGNTAFHLATLLSRDRCLRTMMVGLAPVDIWMMLTSVPNKLGITIQDMLDLTRCRAKLTEGLRVGRVTAANAQQTFAMAKQVSQDANSFLTEQLKRAEDMVRRSGGPSEIRPTFDLRRVPTVALLRSQEGEPARAASS